MTRHCGSIVLQFSGFFYNINTSPVMIHTIWDHYRAGINIIKDALKKHRSSSIKVPETILVTKPNMSQLCIQICQQSNRNKTDTMGARSMERRYAISL